MNPVLTIIVPSYKTFPYMDQCLPTFVSNYLNGKIEVILIDDGSPDESLSKALKYEKKYPGLFKAVHKSNGGHGSVINYGVQLAKGKYFKVVDGDDYVDTVSLEKLVDHLEKTDADCVVSDHKIITDNKEKLVKGKIYDGEGVESFRFAIHSVTYKTSIFLKNKIILREGVFYEDNEFFLFPLPYLKTIEYVPLAVYQYRLGNSEQSVTIWNTYKHRKDLEIVFKDILEYELQIKNITPGIEKIFGYVKSYIFISYAIAMIWSKEHLKIVKMIYKNWLLEVLKDKYALENLKKYKLFNFLNKTNCSFVSFLIARIYIRKKNKLN